MFFKDRVVLIRNNEVLKRNSTVAGFVTMSLILMTLLDATTTVVASIPPAKAQSPPISVVGNPHGFTTGPQIPSCRADFHQGPPNDLLKGCKFTP
jgi:hypothetical protein